MGKNIINNKSIKDGISSTGTIILLFQDPYNLSQKVLIRNLGQDIETKRNNLMIIIDIIEIKISQSFNEPQQPPLGVNKIK